MQPPGTHITYGPAMGWPSSMMTRVPGGSDTPSGTVTRRTFFSCPSGAITTAPTTGSPDSRRPPLPVKQTCLGLGSGLVWQTLVHGAYRSCGCSRCSAGAGLGVSWALGWALGCALGCALGAGCCARAYGVEATPAAPAMVITTS